MASIDDQFPGGRPAAAHPSRAALPRTPSGREQFAAVLHKNWLLRLKGGRKWFGLGGWAAATLDVLVPVLFFLVMCIPKHYMRPLPSPLQLAPAYPADMAGWGELYMGPASDRPDSSARILFSPNTTAVRQLMLLFAKASACPPDAARPRRNSSASFYQYWAASAGAAGAAGHPECVSGSAAACRAQPACYLPLFERQLSGHASSAGAAAEASALPGTVDATLDFSGWAAAWEKAEGKQSQEPERQQGIDSGQTSGTADSSHGSSGSNSGGGVGGSGVGGISSGRGSRGSPLQFKYVIRMNHTDVPPTRMRLNQFDLLPGNQYKQYWFFSNLQALVEQAMLAHAVAASSAGAGANSARAGAGAAGAGAGTGHPSTTTASGTSASFTNTPGSTSYDGSSASSDDSWLAGAAAASPPLLPLALSLKPFPWPALTLDLGATAAALFFNMLLVFAFLQPTRAAVASIVQEKELLLREGMRILGLQDRAYWFSWFLTHWAGMAASGTLCALVGLYPFAHSSLWLMLAFYWLVAAALLLFGYCLSTLFSTARVAGGAAAVLYSLAMMPGYLMPSLQPYGGPGWALSCLLPPSAISLFASVLVKHEAVQQGLTWATLSQPITVEHSFSAASVYCLLLLDILLYSLLLWYLDKVMPSEIGQRLPWTFFLSPGYWRPQRLEGGSGEGPAGAPGRGAGASREIDDGVAVRIAGLRKVFHTTDGMQKVAVDGLSLDIPRGRVTALLGQNGAGKTTTISILTGLLTPSGGDAFFYPSGHGAAGSAASAAAPATAAASAVTPAAPGGLSVRHAMPAIRGGLGVCPQFDVLWPQLTVREHLELFAAIKGYAREDRASLAAAAAAEVGLGEKLGAAAGELSGGQRRKLSVALAFVGDPAVVILDEPTSGMDPYTRRLTWEVIQRRRRTAGTAVLLTTHSMEEADLLADQIAIMAHGRLAALGTSLDLKSRFGVGYTLTVSLATTPSADEAGHADQADDAPAGSNHSGPSSGGGSSLVVPSGEGSEMQSTGMAGSAGAGGDQGGSGDVGETLTALVRQHIPEAQLLASSGSEASYRLPKEAAPAFPPLLRALQQPHTRQRLGISGYGLTVTTLEEVFLKVSESASASYAADMARADVATGDADVATDDADADVALPGEDRSEFVLVNLPRASYLKGWALWWQQLRGLLAKRALCAARDKWAALVQVAVPVLLVALALWGNRVSTAFPNQPPLVLDRPTALSGNPAAYGASDTVRQGGSGTASLQTFLSGYLGAQDSGTARQLILPYLEPLGGTLDDWLLQQWYNSSGRYYDAFFLQTLPSNLTGAAAAAAAAPLPPELQYTAMANQTAIHALPAAITQVHAAMLRWLMGDERADIQLSSHPLPVLPHEEVVRIGEAAGELLLVMCVVLAAAVLTASFAVFLVRERSSGSKWVQLVAGMRGSAFWAANLLFDLALYSVPAALMVALFVGFHLPAYSGQRLAAAGAMLWGFAPAGLCLTYLVQAAFQDEVRALVRTNTLYFTSGYLGYLAVWILDTIQRLLPSPGVDRTRRLLRLVLQTLSPHFCLARGMHLIGETYQPDRFGSHMEAALAAAGLVGASPGSAETTGGRGGIGGGINSSGTSSSSGMSSSGGFSSSGTSSSSSPWAWDVTGELLASLAGQAVMYGAAVLLVEAGLLPRLWHRAQAAWVPATGTSNSFGGRGGSMVSSSSSRHPAARGGYERLPGRDDREASAAAAAEAAAAAAAENGQAAAGEEEEEDEDVVAERRALQSGRPDPASLPVALLGVSKTYWPQAGIDSHAHSSSDATDHDMHSRGGAPNHDTHSRGGAPDHDVHSRGDVIGLLRRHADPAGSGAGRAVRAVQDLWLTIGRRQPRGGSRAASSGSLSGSGASGGGECFGLLGVNGAGKTTTFKMVTGEVVPDAGDAVVCGTSLLQQPSAARQHLGYCPQASALPAQMTGREVLRLYGRLRGLPERLVASECARLLKHLGLAEYADRACGSYSGGNRRKLSVAVALVGGAQVILLDEPSTGMDPGARRALWGVIREEMRGGRTVLLTSHSMEECEAVCGRVGIMSAGRLRALGSVQHLKDRHGQGYSLEMRVAPSCVAAARQLVAACCPSASCRVEHWQAGEPGKAGEIAHTAGATDSSSRAGVPGSGSVQSVGVGEGQVDDGSSSAAHLSFSIPQNQTDLPALFAALEDGRATAGVLEYSLSQTTLEQVFLALASSSALAASSQHIMDERAA